MSYIPAFPLLVSADDLIVHSSLKEICETETFRRRVTYFSECAKTIRTCLAHVNVTDDNRAFLDDIVRVLNCDDVTLNDFADANIGAVVEAVIQQHLLMHDIGMEECETFETFLSTTMNSRKDGEMSVFQRLLTAYSGLEYTTVVFAVASDIIDIANMSGSPQCQVLN